MTLPHRAHRPRRARDHVDPELRAEARHWREAGHPHLLCGGGARGSPTPRDYDETGWNNSAIATVASKGSAAGPIMIYLASKTLAERAAWKFVTAHKAELAWDLVVINPPWIFGVRRRFLAAPLRPIVLNPCGLTPRTAISQPRAND